MLACTLNICLILQLFSNGRSICNCAHPFEFGFRITPSGPSIQGIRIMYNIFALKLQIDAKLPTFVERMECRRKEWTCGICRAGAAGKHAEVLQPQPRLAGSMCHHHRGQPAEECHAGGKQLGAAGTFQDPGCHIHQLLFTLIRLQTMCEGDCKAGLSTYWN